MITRPARKTPLHPRADPLRVGVNVARKANFEEIGPENDLANYIPRIRRIGGCYGFTSKPPAARNGVNAITKKPRDGLFSNLVYTLVVIVS